MKLNSKSKYVKWGITAFCVIAASIVFYYLMFHSSNIRNGIHSLVDILLPVVFGLVVAYLLTPVLNHVEYYLLTPLCNKLNIKETRKRKSAIRATSILITLFLMITLIYALVYMLLSQIVPSIINIVNNFDTYINNMTTWLNKILEDNPDLGESVIQMLNRYSGELENFLNNTVLTTTGGLIKTVSLSVLNTLQLLFDFIVGVMISVYVLASKEKFAGQAKKIVYAIFEKKTANIVISNSRFVHKTFSGFISGKILDSIIIGLICFIGTTLLNTPYRALVSVIIGVTNIIPFFGPWLGGIPCCILVFVVNPSQPLNVLYFAIFVLLLQQIDGNFIGPKILGQSTGIPSFWIIFSITFFGGIFGVIGMIVGVPIFAVIYAVIKELVNIFLHKKNMPQDSASYMSVEWVDEEGFHNYMPEYKLNKEKKKEQNRKMLFRSSENNHNVSEKVSEGRQQTEQMKETEQTKATEHMGQMEQAEQAKRSSEDNNTEE